VGSSNWTRLLGILLFGVLVVTSCSDNAQSPVVQGSPPDYLAGVWDVIDTSMTCGRGPGGLRIREDEFTDTICVGGPDFTTYNAREVWDMYLKYENIVPGAWTDPIFEYCSGIVSDTLILVFCQARASATLEDCDFTVRFYTSAIPNGDQWMLLRWMERIEGEDCGHRKGDSTVYCRGYVTRLTRIGDAPESCAGGDSSTIGR
jgi:hypothetical protein